MSKWIRVTDELPKRDEIVWGYDCFYGGQGECMIDRGRLMFTDGNDDCLITHWRHVESQDLHERKTLPKCLEFLRSVENDLPHSYGQDGQ